MMEIRLAKPEDITLLQQRFREYRQELCVFDPALAGETDSLVNAIPARVKSRMLLTAVAAEDGEIAGFLFASMRRQSGKPGFMGFVDDTFVAPEWRGTDLSRQLFEFARSWFAEGGVTHVELHVLVGNCRAERYWNKLGAKPNRTVYIMELTKEGEHHA